MENLSEYMFSDVNFNEEDYLQGSIKAGKVDGEQYLLPLAVRSSYWLVQENVKHETVLEEIDSTSSTETILNCIIEDYQDHEKEDYFTEIRQFYTMSGDYVLLLYDLLEQTGALHINWDERSVVVNEELFAVVVDYVKLQVEASQRNIESGGTLVSDYEVLFDLCTVISSNANPTYTLHYLNTISSTLHEEELDLLPLPLQGEEREYAVGISMLGMVGKDSKYKEEAWQVLKAMMDVPADAWMEIYGGDSLKETPIALQTNYDLIAMFSQEQTADIMANEQSYAGISLSAKQCEMLKEMIDNTTRGYIFDYNVYSKFGSDSYALLSEEAYNINELCGIIVNEIEDYIQE